jgi:outer membrane protein assembly factor BamB
MKSSHTLACAAILAALQYPTSSAEHWPQFRGPNASGVSSSAKPPTEFGPGTNQLWKIEVPSGMSSPCVWGDRILLTVFAGGRLETHCYARRDGKLLWKADARAEKIEDFNTAEGSPAASTPATDGERVVSYFGSCGLICHDLDGKELWRHPLPVAQTSGGFGSGSSPLLVGGLVVVNRDQAANCSLLAVNAGTGRKAWEASRLDVTQSFGTPMLWNNNGTEEIVMSGSLKLKAYDVTTGAERWSLAGMPAFTCTTPVSGDGLLFFAGWAPGKADGPAPKFDDMAKPADKDGDGVVTLEEAKAAGSDAFFKPMDTNGDGKLTPDDFERMAAMMAKGENVLVAVKPGGKGELPESQVAWKQTRGLPYVPSPLHYQGRVYIVKDGGMLSSFDAQSGRKFYEQERLDAIGNYYASPVAADGRVYLASLNGRVTVVAAGGEQPRILGRADFGERIAATPALVDGQLYLRTPTALFAFGR